jgi:hypothetical protein
MTMSWCCVIMHDGVEPFPGLPACSAAHFAQFVAWVDGILLKSAALVSMCDPGVDGNGGAVYPTTLASNFDVDKMSTESDRVHDSGTLAPTPGDQRKIAEQLCDGCGSFCNNYCAELCVIFGMTPQRGVSKAALDIVGRFAAFCNACGSRHTNFRVMNPYWIEPTSLFARPLGTPGESFCNGPMTYTKNQGPIAYMDSPRVVSRAGDHTQYDIGYFRSRSSGFILFHHAHALDGLGLITVYHAVLGESASTGNNKDLCKCGVDADDFGRIVWRRGDSGLPPP